MDSEPTANPQPMVGFGRKQAWLAIREGEADTVRTALALRDLGPAPWRDGVDMAYLTDDRLLLTPLLPGAGGARWLLVAGRWLLRPRVNVEVAELSWMLGTEVQLFSTYRVGEMHRWERAVDGELTRAFAYLGDSGEVERWLGPPDPAELDLGLPAHFDENHEDVLVSEKDVLRLAGAWSVNPDELDGQPAPGPLHMAATP
jgi:hypothetical protein